MIEFANVSKTYRVADTRWGIISTLRHLIRPRYRRIEAVRDLSFRIGQGELVGFIGENGAGKSTVVKMATGILRPDGGTVTIDGIDVSRNRKRCARRFGVVFGQRRSLWWQLSAREGMEALGRIYGIPPVERQKRIAKLIDLFELGGFIDRPIRQLSLGQRVRSEMASCFVHGPTVVFLDEPTIGMDVMAKIKMREYIKRINEEDNVSVLLTSHDLFNVERVCERVLIMDGGRLLLDDSFESIRARYGTQRMLSCILAEPAGEDLFSDLAGPEVLPRDDPWKLQIRFNPRKVSIVELIGKVQERISVVDYTVEDNPIDELVAEIYRAEGVS